jgi:putative MATE family efflux protein
MAIMNERMEPPSIGKLSLFPITWPIFVELGLQTLLRTSNTFMLSFHSDEAVAAVGVANEIIIMVILVFNMVSIGSAVVISHELGAGRLSEVKSVIGMSIFLNLLLGIGLSALVMALSRPLLSLFSLDSATLSLAMPYLLIAGGGLFIQGVLTAAVAMIQAHGLTRQTMVVAILMNVGNVLGNYLIIAGPLSYLELGVTGVAVCTIVCQLAGLGVNLHLLNKTAGGLVWSDMLSWKRARLLRVLHIGVPASLNTLSYNAKQFVVTAIIASLGSVMLTAKIYTHSITLIIVVLGVALSKGVQIIVGRQVGAGQTELAYRTVLRCFRQSLVITLAAVSLVCLWRTPLLAMFTDTKEIVELGGALLLYGFLLEPGRNMNVIFERALQAAGDARFAAASSVLIMWLFSVPMAYFLGVGLGYGLYGIWASFIVDEWLRGSILYFRWRSRRWERRLPYRRARAG